MQIFTDYLKALNKFKAVTVTEHTYRTDLENLLNAIKDAVNKKYKIMQEPQRDDEYGAPDYRVSFNDMVVGYVENKKIGADLKVVLKSEQIARYIKLSDNILLTNYLDWVWIRKGKERGRASLCTEFELADRKFTPTDDKVLAVYQLIKNFYDIAPEGIAEPEKLAKALAERAKQLKTYLKNELDRQHEEDQEGRLFGLYNTFQKLVDHELTLESFTDTFAQMLVYGLFMARLNSGKEKIDLYNVKRFIPGSFELIRELVGFLEVLNELEYTETKWIVEEVLSILNTMDVDSIHRLLSFNTVSGKSKKKNSLSLKEASFPLATRTPCDRDDDSKQPTSNEAMMHDPFIYFYEDFLSAYDKALKKAKGVYYTPMPVVNFIVRAVDDILKDTFGITKGLADEKNVTVLDFACGTGTFLLEVIRKILEKSNKAKKDLYVKEHILKNIYGFEYMMAPYTVAHLKLSQYLKDKGYHLTDKERLNVLLTNTMEPIKQQTDKYAPALTKESRKAQVVKDTPILVITGNPPYSYQSENKGDWISKLNDDYYFFNGVNIDERQSRALQDDYVKFIRFAHWKMEKVDSGIIAIITNSSYIDNPTCRGMRQKLLKDFDRIYVIDLHGSSKKKEKAPDGCKDENVFDIEQGVCITILIKKHNIIKDMLYFDVMGTRQSKYNFLNCTLIKNLKWISCLGATNCNFIPEDINLGSIYNNYISLKDIFKDINVGVKTARDETTVHYTIEHLNDVVKDFKAKSVEFLKDKYKIKQDTQGWSIVGAKKDITTDYNDNNQIKILYRPFDIRYTYYTGKSNGFISRPANNIMHNLLHDNIALVITRQLAKKGFFHILATDHIIDMCTLSNLTKEVSYIAPLYTYEEELFTEPVVWKQILNLNTNVITHHYYNNKQHIDSNKTMSYIYAVLHSPTYRTKYADFLKTDFPRIPFTDDYQMFLKLAELGWDLIQAHLLKSTQPDQLYPKLGGYTEKGDNTVTIPHYTDTQKRLYINGTQYFDNVPADVYNFYIGGYQVLQKYLKDRKGRTLSLDEINNVESVVKILQFTIDQMQKIDALTKVWI